MPSFANTFEKLKNQMFKTYSGDAGKMLLHTGTIAWIVSAVAQIFAIMTNDEVSKEQKKFMIPQEMADAAINILSFYTLTNGIQNMTKWFAKSGKIITPEIRKFCENNGILVVKDADGNTPNIGKAILDKINELESTIKVDKEEGINIGESEIAKLNDKIKDLKAFYNKTYSPFESGCKVVGNILGAVVSSNIVTPMLRNPFAAAKQKQAIAQEKYEKYEKMEQLQNAVTPALPMQNKSGMDVYRAQIVRPSAGMKV